MNHFVPLGNGSNVIALPPQTRRKQPLQRVLSLSHYYKQTITDDLHECERRQKSQIHELKRE
ncbi:unnamed protein product, partial [Sphenostylis stenocarpa]